MSDQDLIRNHRRSGPSLRFDGWTLNLQSGELERGETRVRLQEHPFQVLKALLERPGEVVTREQLIARLWPDGVVDFDTGLNTAVRRLRGALGDTADTPRYVETLPRRGYRFIGPVGPACPDAAESATPDPVEPPLESIESVPFLPSPKAARRWTFWVVAAIAIGGLTIGIELLKWHRTDQSARQGGTTRSVAANSLAVLSFDKLDDDPNSALLAEDLSDALQEALARVGGLRVAGRASSQRFSSTKADDVRDIGTQLNVKSLVEGAVRASGPAVRIQVALVDAGSGARVWSHVYERRLGDAFNAQSEIADAIVAALKLGLPNTRSQIELGGTHDEAAMSAYLEGVRMADATVPDAAQGRANVGKFDEAVRLDPNFALAYAARSRALMDYGGHFMVDAMPDAFSRAQIDAERAVALAPTLGEAHAALADVYMGAHLDFELATGAYERAIELSPNDARVLRAYATFQGYMGRFDSAIRMARKNVALDPLNVYSHLALGEVLLDARHYPEAAAEFAEAIRLQPGRASEAYQRRGRALYLAGQYELAAGACEAEPDRYASQLCLPLVYEKLGRHAEAESTLQAAIAEQGEYSAFQFAEICAQRGDTAQALTWLETAVRVRDPGLIYLKTDPFLDPLHGQNRFQSILRALRFPN